MTSRTLIAYTIQRIKTNVNRNTAIRKRFNFKRSHLKVKSDHGEQALQTKRDGHEKPNHAEVELWFRLSDGGVDFGGGVDDQSAKAEVDEPLELGKEP